MKTSRFYIWLYAFIRIVRKALNLLVDEKLVIKARNHGLNLSKFFENQLRGYFNFIEEKANNYIPDTKASNNDNSKGKGAYGLVVMTSPSHGGGRRFKSG